MILRPSDFRILLCHQGPTLTPSPLWESDYGFIWTRLGARIDGLEPKILDALRTPIIAKGRLDPPDGLTVQIRVAPDGKPLDTLLVNPDGFMVTRTVTLYEELIAIHVYLPDTP